MKNVCKDFEVGISAFCVQRKKKCIYSLAHIEHLCCLCKDFSVSGFGFKGGTVAQQVTLLPHSSVSGLSLSLHYSLCKVSFIGVCVCARTMLWSGLR